MTTGPRGEALTYDERLNEILTRYHPTDIVGTAMLQAEPAIRAASHAEFGTAGYGRMPVGQRGRIAGC
jgi:hypothetical protein